MLRLLLRAALLMLALIGAVHADVVSPSLVVDQNGGNMLLGVNNVTIGGQLYNAVFHEGNFHDVYCNGDPSCGGLSNAAPYSQGFAQAASETLLALFSGNGLFQGGKFDLSPGSMRGCGNTWGYCYAYTPYQASIEDAYVPGGKMLNHLGWAFENQGPILYSNDSFDKAVGLPGGSLYLINSDPDAHTWVTWAQVPAAVPLPATAWLFMSALLGFLGISRRKSHAISA